MNGGLGWVLVGLGLTVLVVRRRTIAVGAVTGQALVLVGLAVRDAGNAWRPWPWPPGPWASRRSSSC